LSAPDAGKDIWRTLISRASRAGLGRSPEYAKAGSLFFLSKVQSNGALLSPSGSGAARGRQVSAVAAAKAEK